MNQPPATLPDTLKEAVARVADRLAQAGIENARFEARVLIGHALGADSAVTVTQGEAAIELADWLQIDMMTMRREGREPMAQILGEKEFWSLTFRVNGSTLTPRPDSETVIEAALARIADRSAPLRVLDLGTGTGCLLLALLSELPNATGLGVDLSDGAVALAQENARRLGLTARAAFLQSDWLEAVEGRFDVILSNPPYIPDADIESLEPEVARFEPHLALAGGVDGLDVYRHFAGELQSVCVPGARIFLECGIGQADGVGALMAAAGFVVAPPVEDLAGVARCVVATIP